MSHITHMILKHLSCIICRLRRHFYEWHCREFVVASFFHLSSSFLNYSKAEEIEAAEYENFCSWLRNCFFVYWHWNIFSDTVTRQPICYCTNDAPMCLYLFAIVMELFNPSWFEQDLVKFGKWHLNLWYSEVWNHECWKPKCVSFKDMFSFVKNCKQIAY